LEKFERGDITIEEMEHSWKQQEKEDAVMNFFQSLDAAKLTRLMNRLNIDQQDK
jgi:hypothetical protein